MGLPRRALAGVAGIAVGLALAFSLLASSAAADQIRGSQWWLSTLHVTRAWQSSRGAGVTVAVLDTGVDTTQADLTGVVTSGPDFTGAGRPPGGPYWGIHGTAMACLIAGHGHGPGNADGIMGVAPAARILSIRVTPESNDPLLSEPAVAARLPGAIAHGIRYAVKHGAAVIDLPLDPVITPGAPGSGGSNAERAAVSYALAHRVVLVAPAGDDGARSDAANYPAAYPGVISVGAFNPAFIKAPYSSRQRYVTVTAAGEDVTAANGTQGYVTVNSTSAASAVVAGVVALIRAQFPTLTPAQVTKAITSSTLYRRRDGTRIGSGFGAVDAAAALMAAARMVEAVPSNGAPGGSGGLAPPSPPAVHSPPSHLRRTLLTDAAIAGALFAVLLAGIFAIGLLRRRRARAARLAEVRAAASVPVQRPPDLTAAAAGPAGFIPAPPGPGIPDSPAFGASLPGGVAADTAPATAGVAAAGWGTYDSAAPRAAPASAPFPGSAFPGSAFPGNDFPGPSTGDVAESTRPADASAGIGQAREPHRMGTVRPPRVSGSPPWDPAPRPDSELPWAQPTAATAAPRALPQRRPPRREPPSWDVIAEEAWPGGPRVAGPHPPPPPSNPVSGEVSRPAAPSGGDPEPRARPVYVWKPANEAGGSPIPPSVTAGTKPRGAPPWEIGESHQGPFGASTPAVGAVPQDFAGEDGASLVEPLGQATVSSSAAPREEVARDKRYSATSPGESTEMLSAPPASDETTPFRIRQVTAGMGGFRASFEENSGTGLRPSSGGDDTDALRPGLTKDSSGSLRPGLTRDGTSGHGTSRGGVGTGESHAGLAQDSAGGIGSALGGDGPSRSPSGLPGEGMAGSPLADDSANPFRSPVAGTGAFQPPFADTDIGAFGPALTDTDMSAFRSPEAGTDSGSFPAPLTGGNAGAFSTLPADSSNGGYQPGLAGDSAQEFRGSSAYSRGGEAGSPYSESTETFPVVPDSETS